MRTQESKTWKTLLTICSSLLLIAAGTYGAKEGYINIKTTIQRVGINLGTQINHNETQIKHTKKIININNTTNTAHFKKVDRELQLLRVQQRATTKELQYLRWRLKFLLKMEKSIKKMKKSFDQISPQEQKAILAMVKVLAKSK